MKIIDRKKSAFSRTGFSLAEVVVASAVMAMMMVVLIGYVQSAGTLWQKSHSTISLANEGNAVLDFVERELWHANGISLPQIGNSSTTRLRYTKEVSDYQLVATTTVLDFQITFDPVTRIASASVITAGSRWASATADGWSIDTAVGTKKLVFAQHNYDIGRSIKSIVFNRLANRLLEVHLVVAILRIEDAEDPGLERKIEYKRSIIMR